METTTGTDLETRPDTEGRCELIEIHLFDANAREEKALCPTEVSVHDLTTVQHYLERGRDDLSLPTVCNRCRHRQYTLRQCEVLNWSPKE